MDCRKSSLFFRGNGVALFVVFLQCSSGGPELVATGALILMMMMMISSAVIEYDIFTLEVQPATICYRLVLRVSPTFDEV